jgi:Sodium/hydrogen exchanger family
MAAVVLLAVLAVATQVFQRLGLGSVLGTLAAGVVLGPWGVNLAHDGEAKPTIAERTGNLSGLAIENIRRKLCLSPEVYVTNGASILQTNGTSFWACNGHTTLPHWEGE